MNFGIFTISLDFELHWGGFEKWPIEKHRSYFEKTRECIPRLLKAFERSGVHCTWATVGMLMHENKVQLQKNAPDHKPSYNNQLLSAYQFISTGLLGENEEVDPYHYAHSLIDKIIKTTGQEIGSHTFSHYYCNEPGQNPDQFLADALSWNKAAQPYGLKAKSLVFPRNQFNKDYISKCEHVGIEVVRVNPIDWWWQIDSTQGESAWKRFNRGLDAYFNIGGKTSFAFDSIKTVNNVWLLPASRLLRPYNPKEVFLNHWKIERIKKEMTVAAKNNECYHLWWHPHNFGRYTKQNLDGLVSILNHYQKLHKEFGMQSFNMAEIAAILNNGKNS